MADINEQVLDEKLEQLERIVNWSPRVISKLEAFIRTSDDYTLFKIDPIQYAAEKGISENESIDLFLHAAKLGLFDLEWNLICGCCGMVFTSLRSISSVHTHFTCDVCRMENHLSLDEMIQVSFTVAPSIRDNAFLHPESLDADDYVYRYRLFRNIQRQPNCGLNADYVKHYSPVSSYLQGGEKLHFNFNANPGFVYVGDILHGTVATILVGPAKSGAELPRVKMTFGLPDMRIDSIDTSPLNLTIATGHGDVKYDYTHYAEVTAGSSEWIFENQMTERACVWLFNPPPEVLTTWMELPPFLSGKRLLTTQTFRNLYRSEVIETNEGLGIHDITFLFTDLKGSTALYDQLGDLKAYHLVRQHFDALSKVIVAHSGAVVKTIGDAVMATFNTPSDGVAAAINIMHAINAFNKEHTEDLILKIGVHSGHSIAVTLNDRLDYFGQTVNIAARVQQMAEANEVYISQDVYAYNGVTTLLDSCIVTPVQANVKGVVDTLQLYKITSSI